MNYLAICQRLARECLGSVNAAGKPTTVASQVGILQNLVEWAAEAYNDIQDKHDNWRWLRSTWTVNTVADTEAYAYTAVTDSRLSATISRFRRWWQYDEDGDYNLQIYLQSSGVGTERRLPFIDWASFRRLYKMGTQNSNQPAHFSIDPQDRLVFGPKPNAVYVVSGEYQMSNQTLDDDADTPEMPADYHMLVVYKGMEKYGQNKVAVEIFNRGAREGTAMMRRLERNQLPGMAFAGPLA